MQAHQPVALPTRERPQASAHRRTHHSAPLEQRAGRGSRRDGVARQQPHESQRKPFGNSSWGPLEARESRLRSTATARRRQGGGQAAMARSALAVLGEANVGRVLAEAAAADVKTVLADQATLAVADAAAAATFGVVARVSVVRVRHDSCAAGWRRGQEQRQNRNTRQGMLLAASKARKASDWRAPQPHSVGTATPCGRATGAWPRIRSAAAAAGSVHARPLPLSAGRAP